MAAEKAAKEIEVHKVAALAATQALSAMKIEHAKLTAMHLASQGLLETTVAREAAAKEVHASMIKEVIEADKQQQASLAAIESTVASHKKFHQEELASLTKGKQVELDKTLKPLKTKLTAATNKVDELEAEALKAKKLTDKLEEQIKSDKRRHRAEMEKEREKLSLGLGGAEAAEVEIRTLKASLAAAQEVHAKSEMMLKAARKKFTIEMKSNERMSTQNLQFLIFVCLRGRWFGKERGQNPASGFISY
jgi:hypothetical protein